MQMYKESKPFSVMSEMHGPHEEMSVKLPPQQMFSMPLILLLLAEEPNHGYALFKKMLDLGAYDESTKASVCYPALRMLKDEGLVDTELVDEGSGPPRKVYHITPAGRITLASMSEHLDRMSKAVEYFQQRYKDLGPALKATRPADGHHKSIH
jgi:PadR family transcriptional regulator PadR